MDQKLAKIKKHMFDDILLAEFNNKVDKDDVRLKSKAITMDDVDDNIKTKLNNMGTPGGTAYDDSELRNRIIDLETIKDDVVTTSKNAFNKETDKLDKDMLNGELYGAYKRAMKVDDILTDKADKEYTEKTYRKKKDPIKEGDMDPDLVDKFNDMIADFYNTKGDMELSMDTTKAIKDLQETTAGLLKSKANLAELNNYRQKTTPIKKSDLEADLAASLDAANKMASATDFAKRSEVDQCRKKAEKITEDDLDKVLSNTIKSVQRAVGGTEDQIVKVYNDKIQSGERKWILDYYGQTSSKTYDHNTGKVEVPTEADYQVSVEPYALRHNVCNFIGTLNLPHSNPKSGMYTFASVLSYLFHCMTHDMSNEKGESGNMSWYSLPNIKAKLDSMGSSVSGLGSIKSRLSAVESENSALKIRVNDLEDDVKTLKDDLAALKKKVK